MAPSSSRGAAQTRRRPSSRTELPPPEIDLQTGRGTRAVVGKRLLGTWVTAALAGARRPTAASVAIRFVGASEGTRLNEAYRPGKRGPTNVLAFPGPDFRHLPEGVPVPLGDIVICLPVLRTEARAQGKALKAHLAHLVVHGTLHLLGYTHEDAKDAVRMEKLEAKVLSGLGFSNPYRQPDRDRAKNR